MFILTEKPGVAKDFAKALGCHFSLKDKCYKDSRNSIIIASCVGHLFQLEEPVFYNPDFKSWKKLPVIPPEFHYRVTAELKDAAKTVITQLKKHSKDEILIATDADREGEIIARECLKAAGITDFSRIKRFWVSQALTPEVIQNGIENAELLDKYSKLAEQGFSRQHSDWLVGINGTRFITNKAGILFPVGRVQTAVLSAISDRCNSIKNFRSEKYYEISASFKEPVLDDRIAPAVQIKGILVAEDGKSKFKNDIFSSKLKSLINTKVLIKDFISQKKECLPPQLYSLNDLQKDAFRYFNYSADKTLKLVQKLYEVYKCVSYPRTPSRVMGSQNVELCQGLYKKFICDYPEYYDLHSFYVIDKDDARVFNDAKLEAHHAIIPLDKLPVNATGEEENIYNLILERFMLAFAPPYRYEKISAVLSAGDFIFNISGRQVLDEGWKRFQRFTRVLKNKDSDTEDVQVLDNINFNNLVLSSVEPVQKNTKPPKHFNEASILAFMENPKDENTGKKLCGLGTPATRHTFIPKLEKSKYIEINNRNIIITRTGEKLLELVKESPLAVIADVSETTRWEERLNENPLEFETETKVFIKNAIGRANE